MIASAAYRVDPVGPLVAGVDVGGTKTALVVTDPSDRILYQQVVATETASVVGQICSLVEGARRRLREDGRDVEAIGVAIPGHVDPSSGSVSMAVNLGITHLALGPLLAAKLGMPSFVEHDARAAALWLSAQPVPSDTPSGRPASAAGDRAASVAYLAVGTGISAGLVVDGELLRGQNGLAGEIGHVVADPDGPVCACGLRGCLEAVAAGPAIARQAEELIAQGRPTLLPEHPTAAEVLRASSAGDPLACEITTRIADHLARAIRGLALSAGVKRVVIGGGVAAAGPALLDPIRSSIAHECAISPLVEAAFAGATVELLPPDTAAGARGAAAIARQRIRAQQREGVGDR